MRMTVWVTHQFVGWHHWPEAPEITKNLRHLHRHVFHVRMEVLVSHDDRDKEFLLLQNALKNVCSGIEVDMLHDKESTLSCEQIAKQIQKKLNASTVTVSEDGENGATISVEDWELRKFCCFVGEEAEGPAATRGCATLFIPGQTSPQAAEQALAIVRRDNGLLKRVYYGAGNDRQMSAGMLSWLFSKTKEVTGYIEIDFDAYDHREYLIKLQKEGFQLVRFVENPLGGAFRDVDYAKWIQGQTIYWEGTTNKKRYITSINDPRFHLDRDVC